MGEYNLSLDVPKSILETEKILKTFSPGQIYKKNKKKTKKNPTGLFFFLNSGFFQPCLVAHSTMGVQSEAGSNHNRLDGFFQNDSVTPRIKTSPWKTKNSIYLESSLGF
jgi:hypothetical protein